MKTQKALMTQSATTSLQEMVLSRVIQIIEIKYSD